MAKQPSPSRALAAKVLYAAFQILKDNDGEYRGRRVIAEIPNRVELTDWDKETYETGRIRWQSVLHFFTIDAVKAGFMRKKGGIWYLTPEGEDAMKLGDIGMLDEATAKYREWSANRKPVDPGDGNGDPDDGGGAGSKELTMTLEQIQQVAVDGLEAHINAKNAYEFQDLSAALLRGMGYFTPFVAPKGKDGGVDIIAYRDPLGTVSPRIKVQVKHRGQTAATVHEIRQLMGLLQKDGDVGIFISIGGFTTDAKVAARSSHIHIELIDLSRFITLWQEFYHKMTDEDKILMPLLPVYFLEPSE